MRSTLVAVVALAALLSGCGQPAGVPPTPGLDAPEGGSGWERLPDPPLSGRVAAVVAAVGEDVLVTGGWQWLCPPNADCAYPDVPPLRDGALLDVSTGEWRPIADAPFGVRHARAVTVGDDVYVLTGCRESVSCDGPSELLRYDTRADRWSELGQVPRPAPPYATLVAVGGRLLVLADSDENGERPDHLYDPATGRWQELPDDPLPDVYDRFAVADGDRLLVFGSPRQGGQAKVGASYDLESGDWTELPEAPGTGYQVWRSGDEAWLNPHFGSAGGGVLDLRTGRWAPFPTLPPGMRGDVDLAGVLGHGTATFEYAAGWVRDTERDVWLRIAARPAPSYDEGVTALGDALVVFGGQRWDDDRDGELVAETWIWRSTSEPGR
jgi:hypothetical protein